MTEEIRSPNDLTRGQLRHLCATAGSEGKRDAQECSQDFTAIHKKKAFPRKGAKAQRRVFLIISFPLRLCAFARKIFIRSASTRPRNTARAPGYRAG